MRKLFWMLCGVTVAVYLVMVLWTLPTISAGAGGLAPFDLRPGGYGYADAMAFLDTITPEASAFYREVQHRFDLVFPTLLAMTLFFALLHLMPRQLRAWRFALAAAALLVATFDYLENRAVAALLAMGADSTPAMVATASQWTVLKSGCTAAVSTAVLLLLLWRGALVLRQRFSRAAAPYTAPRPRSP